MDKTPLEALLDAVEQAARRADLPALARLAPALEAEMACTPPSDPALIRRLRGQAGRVARCLEAARQGVQAARRRLTEIRRAGGPLRTYDRQGQTLSHMSSAPPARRL